MTCLLHIFLPSHYSVDFLALYLSTKKNKINHLNLSQKKSCLKKIITSKKTHTHTQEKKGKKKISGHVVRSLLSNPKKRPRPGGKKKEKKKKEEEQLES